MVKDRQSSLKKMDDQSDLLSRLLDANELEDEKGKLTKSEMIGEWFLQRVSVLLTVRKATFLFFSLRGMRCNKCYRFLESN
jgi:hypothetical protein